MLQGVEKRIEGETRRQSVETTHNFEGGGPSRRRTSPMDLEMENVVGADNLPEKASRHTIFVLPKRPKNQYTVRKSVRHPAEMAPPRKMVRCYLCNEESFHLEQCPYTLGMVELMCHNCGEHGHYYTACTKPRKNQWTAATTPLPPTHPPGRRSPSPNLSYASSRN